MCLWREDICDKQGLILISEEIFNEEKIITQYDVENKQLKEKNEKLRKENEKIRKENENEKREMTNEKREMTNDNEQLKKIT